MRLVPNKSKFLVSILRSKIFLFFLFLLILYFIFLNLKAVPLAFELYERSKESKEIFIQKQKNIQKNQIFNTEKQKELLEKRFRKEFLNELDEGEYLIVLHGQETGGNFVTEKLEINFFSQKLRDLKLWWKNL